MSPLVTLFVLLFAWIQAPSQTERPKFITEGANASFKDGVLDLRSGRGWLRLSRPTLDFDLGFEIRSVTPEADPGLIVRTWTGRELWPGKGYRFKLPMTATVDPSSLLEGRRQKATILNEGRLDFRPDSEWQRFQVVAQGSRMRMFVNGTLAGEFSVESYGGFIMFDNRKGRVELRNMTLRSSDPNESIPSDIRKEKQVTDAGGQPPEVTLEVKPVYSREALHALAQGRVSMQAVVLADGSVGPVRLTRLLHPDLDISAVAALKAWRFRPATIDGQPVPVVVEVEITFTLK